MLPADYTPPSPAAQAVLDAAWQLSIINCKSIAAALRAAALVCKRDRAILLSLADELEGADG